MDSEKSSSGRVIWTVDNGRLHETSPDSYAFTLTSVDTETLLHLLVRNADAIHRAAMREKAQAIQQDIRVDSYADNMPTERGQSGGYTSSITIDQDLRGHGTKLIKPSRGA